GSRRASCLHVHFVPERVLATGRNARPSLDFTLHDRLRKSQARRGVAHRQSRGRVLCRIPCQAAESLVATRSAQISCEVGRALPNQARRAIPQRRTAIGDSVTDSEPAAEMIAIALPQNNSEWGHPNTSRSRTRIPARFTREIVQILTGAVQNTVQCVHF